MQADSVICPLYGTSENVPINEQYHYIPSGGQRSEKSLTNEMHLSWITLLLRLDCHLIVEN